MNQISSEAIIIRRTNYGEADRILQLLTPDYGVVSAIAKGIRREKSKLAGGLELFAVCDVTVIQGRGDLGIVSSARLRDFYGKILQEYERMQFAYECIKLVTKAANAAPEPEFYELLKNAYIYLNQLSIDWRLIEIWFRLKLSHLLGRGLNLHYDQEGANLEVGQAYHFDVGDMTFVKAVSGRFGADEIKFLRIASVKEPDVLTHIGGIDTVLENCLWLARAVSE